MTAIAHPPRGIIGGFDEADGMPTPRRHWVVACIIMGVTLTSLDSAIANIALPTLAQELSASAAATVWVVNAYHLALAVSLLPAAAFGEILGHKRVYAAGLILFTLASLGCALSHTLGTLVAARLLQGVGGASVAALGPALIREAYPRRLLGSGLALIALAVAVSNAVGPTVAALILSVARWPWLFLVNLPICALAVPTFIAVAPFTPGQPRRFDALAAILNALALGLVVVGVDDVGARTVPAVAEIAGGAVCIALLVWHQSGRAQPLLPLDLLRIPVFALGMVTSTCSYTAQILAYVSLPFRFETVFHRSAVASGLLITPWPLLVAVAAPVAGRMLVRYSPSILGAAGLTVMAVGLALMTLVSSHSPDWAICCCMALCGIGFGFFQTPNNTALMLAGPAARSGAAGGMLAVARTVGFALGAALVAVIFRVAGAQATTNCLIAGAGFSLLGAVVSALRLAKG